MNNYKNRVLLEVLDVLTDRVTEIEDDYVCLNILAEVFEIKREILEVIEREQKASDKFAWMLGSPDQLT